LSFSLPHFLRFTSHGIANPSPKMLARQRRGKHMAFRDQIKNSDGGVSARLLCVIETHPNRLLFSEAITGP
jgi:hypothetical protein